MQVNLEYLFLKQFADIGSYFGHICLDVPRPEMRALVFSGIESAQIGNVRFQAGPTYNRRSYRRRLQSWTAYLAAASWCAFRVKGNPLLFIVAQPPFLPFLGYLQKKILGRNYVVWIDDVYPDVLVRKGVLGPNSWITQLWGSFNRLVLANSEHVFTLGPYMLDVVRQYLDEGFPATIVPTWVDTDVIYPVPKSENAWAKGHGLEGKFTIMYSGNFGETHDVELLLKAASLLRARDDLHFVLIGAGAKWESIRSSAQDLGHANITVLPWQPEEILFQSLSSADVSFVSLSMGIEGLSMPSKTYNAMAAGTALLASCARESDLAYVIEKAACGVIVRPGSVEDIVSAIEDLSSHPDETATYKRNARFAAVEHYSRTVNARIVRETLERIVVDRGR